MIRKMYGGTKQTSNNHLVVVCEMAIGDGNSSGTLNGINQSISAVSHGNMVNPNMARAKDGNSITITLSPYTIVVLRISDKSTIPRLNVKNFDSMDDHILDELEGKTSPIDNVDVSSSSINGLITCHNQLLAQPNGHAMSKGDPQGSSSCNRIPKGTRNKINHVII